MTGIFDGEAISRADREFLAGLGDHPLMRPLMERHARRSPISSPTLVTTTKERRSC
jgi:hypothetical protein